MWILPRAAAGMGTGLSLTVLLEPSLPLWEHGCSGLPALGWAGILWRCAMARPHSWDAPGPPRG